MTDEAQVKASRFPNVGSIAVAGPTVFFKIDCFDLDYLKHSPDAADPAVTRRVMTIMLVEEY